MVNKKQWIEDLAADVRQIILEAERIRELSEEQFNKKRTDGGWSVGQVLEHLHFYSHFYLPLLEQIPTTNASEQLHFKSGWLGGYFTKLMKPGAQGVLSRKMKSPANATPKENLYSKESIELFLKEQHRLLQILKNMDKADWNARLPISLSKMIRLKAGDVLQFVIAHEQRHMLQINNLLKQI